MRRANKKAPKSAEAPPLTSRPVKRLDAKIWLEDQPGQHPGSVIVQEVDGLVNQFKFAAAPYAVIFALAERSYEDRKKGAKESRRGFLTKQELQTRLKELGVKSPWYLKKHIYRARRTLGEIGQVGKLSGMAWAHEFLERSETGSYRLSLPSEHVFFLD